MGLVRWVWRNVGASSFPRAVGRAKGNRTTIEGMDILVKLVEEFTICPMWLSVKPFNDLKARERDRAAPVRKQPRGRAPLPRAPSFLQSAPAWRARQASITRHVVGPIALDPAPPIVRRREVVSP
jgi:hypothetical protein